MFKRSYRLPESIFAIALLLFLRYLRFLAKKQHVYDKSLSIQKMNLIHKLCVFVSTLINKCIVYVYFVSNEYILTVPQNYDKQGLYTSTDVGFIEYWL